MLQCLCLVVLLFGFTVSQNENETTTAETDLSDVICKSCNCTDAVIDCTARDVKLPFEIQDWDGVKSLNPTTVDLSQNPLTGITRISKLPIQSLNFSNCEISSIEDASFVYLTDLVSLDLSSNKITTDKLSRRIFVGPFGPTEGLTPFSRIQYLSLANNDIHSLPQDLFTFMAALTTLDLSGNPLAFIDQVTMAAITDLVNLRELNLSGCELESLPEGLFRRQRRLRRLDLSNNRLATVPAVLNEASNLHYLNFNKNPIQTLDTDNAIKNLTKLQDLRFSRHSKLQNISAGALAGLPELVSLHISYNPRLSYIDSDFLTYVDEHDVEIWPALTELQDLQFSRHSKLQNISAGALADLPELVTLHISYNPRLSYIDSDFLTYYVDEHDVEIWPALTELHLNNNNLSAIASSYVHRWDKLISIDVRGNPFNCDCKNQWTVDVLVPLLNNLGDPQLAENMICMKPIELRGVTFAQLQSQGKTLVCAESENLVDQPVVANLAIILGIMIGIFVTFPTVLIVVLLWRKGYFARCKTKVPDLDDDEETDAF